MTMMTTLQKILTLKTYRFKNKSPTLLLVSSVDIQTASKCFSYLHYSMAIMNWNNLNRNRCPKCSKELDFISDKEMMMCTINCGFMISDEKMKVIVSENITKRLLRDNHQSLNEL